MSQVSALLTHTSRRAPVLFLLFALLLPALACSFGRDNDSPAGLSLPTVTGGPTVGFSAPSENVVYINGAPLSPIDRSQLEALIGPIPAGRYWVDRTGNFGSEGGPPLVNLVQAYNQLYNAPGYGSGWEGGWIDRGPGGTTGGDGETCYYNDPESGASVMYPCN